MRNLIIILGDHLTHGVSSLSDIDKTKDIVLMGDLYSELTFAEHYKQSVISPTNF